LAPLALARTVYVRDTLYVPLRAGQSSEYHILHQGIKSGTALELLETNDDTGYSKVRMENGMEGWLQTQYLQDEPIAKDQLTAADDKLSKLEAEHQKTLLRLQDVQSQRDSLNKDLNDTKARFDDVSKRLTHVQEMSAHAVDISKRNAELKANEQVLKDRIRQLSDANTELQDTSNQSWFLRGAAVVIIALLIGFLVGRRIYHRRNSGWA